MLDKLRPHINQMRGEAECLVRGHYPGFVTTRDAALDQGSVTVFMSHSIEPVEFERQLLHLADNGYTTLDVDAFLRHISGEASAPPRSVLLTIDDGRASVWTCGFPLLKKYQMKAVVFLIPGYITDRERGSPTLDDVWGGRCSLAELPDRDPELMSWSEIRAMAASGLVDFQSHTLYHHRVPISGRIVDYVNPRHRHEATYDLALTPGLEEQLRDRGLESLYGAPIHASDSLLSGRPRYWDDPLLAQACIEQVQRSGGTRFFQSSSWRGHLDRLVRDWRDGHPRGRLEGEVETRRAVVADLRRARGLIELNVPDTRVRHLCLPYGIGSELAVQAAKEAGHLTTFWCVLPERATNRSGEDPYRCPRVKADYLFRLPGRGRQPLAAVLWQKLTRRAAGRRVY
jgi:hypothetical protein